MSLHGETEKAVRLKTYVVSNIKSVNEISVCMSVRPLRLLRYIFTHTVSER